MDTYNKIMEKVWLLIAIAAVSYGVYLHVSFGGGEYTTIMYIAAGIAFGGFFLKRFMRKRMEKFMDEHGDKIIQRELEKRKRKEERKNKKNA